MSNLTLPAQVEKLSLSESRVCIYADPDFARTAHLHVGKLSQPFSQISAPPRTTLTSLKKKHPVHLGFPALAAQQITADAVDAAEDFQLAHSTADRLKQAVLAPHKVLGKLRARARHSQQGHQLWLNKLPDWSLEGGRTFQLSLPSTQEAKEVEICDSLTLPPHKDQVQFSVALGIHRARADLLVHIDTPATGAKDTLRTPFQINRMGGREITGYQAVYLDLPPCDHEQVIRLSVAYLGYEGRSNDTPPFVFVANPELSTREAIFAKAHTAAHFSASDTPGLYELTGPPVPGARWFQARFPAYALSPGGQISLSTDSVNSAGRANTAKPTQTSPIYHAQDITVQLIQDAGHSLTLKADTAQTYAIYIDGAPGFLAHIGETSTQIRLPSAYLTGMLYHLTVRDHTGSQVLLETYIQPPRIMTPLDVIQRESRKPFTGSLFAQAAHRYKGMQAHLTAGGSPDDQAQIARAVAVLEAGYDNVKLAPLSFPKLDNPDVSVIIPCHNKVEVTYSALCALLLAKNTSSFEIILVDDGSTDKTTELADLISGITVIRNDEAQRFLRSCNLGVAQARGDYVVLLNNDTEVTAGWLDALIDSFSRFDNVGLAGAQLLYPDGSLQDAGGIIWGTGNPWNYGGGQSPDDPRYSYARQADYLTGAAMMTTRAIWDEVGGLSAYLEPMYFEDTDFAFKVREAGYKTYYVPASVVFHYEGMTSGTNTTSGFKRYQEVNRGKFKQRWRKEFSNFGPEGQNVDLEKDRGIIGRVLFIDYTTPRPDQDAGGYAAVQEMKLVQSLGYKVSFLPENLAHFDAYTDALKQDGVEVITAPYFLSMNEFLELRGSEFDAVYITRYHVAANVIDQIRKVNPQAKIILNNADLHFLRQMRAALLTGDAQKMAEAKAVQHQELHIMRQVDLVLSYNEVEHSVIQSHTDGQANVMKCPWVLDFPDTVPGLEQRQGLSFLGSYRHPPNAEGISWFVKDVMPLVADFDPTLGLSIYGSGLTDEIRDLKSDTIDPVGFVEVAGDAYDQHRIFVAPLLSGAGIKGKVLAALAHGVPCVLTPTAAEGIGLRHKHDCFIATTPEEWRDAIKILSQDAETWQRISDTSRAYMQDRFSLATARADMRAAFEAIDMFNPFD